MVEYAYRYDDRCVSNGVDEWDNPYPGHSIKIYLSKYIVLKHTPKGFWIEYWGNPNGKKFILTNARKRFACLTLEEAKESFLARKNRQRRILAAQIADVETAIRKIETRYKHDRSNTNGARSAPRHEKENPSRIQSE